MVYNGNSILKWMIEGVQPVMEASTWDIVVLQNIAYMPYVIVLQDTAGYAIYHYPKNG